MDDNNQEPTTNNTTPPTGDPQGQPTSTQDEDFSGKKHMAAEINRLRAELADREAKAKAAADEAERKKLEQQGEWQKIADNAKSELETARLQHAAEVRHLTLEAKLAGMDPLAMKGAIADCPSDADLEAYVTDIKEKHKHLFAGATAPARSTPEGMPAAGGGSGNVSWSKIKADMRSRDPKLVDPAIEKYEAYVREHGQKPPGWD